MGICFLIYTICGSLWLISAERRSRAAEAKRPYESLFMQHMGDSIKLGNDGADAYQNENYDFCVLFYEQAARINSDDNFRDRYGFYIGALVFLSRTSEAHTELQKMVEEAKKEIKENNGFYGTKKNLGRVCANLTVVKEKLPPAERIYFDKTINDITSLIPTAHEH
jgi:hypothetical protein